ncbi:N-acetyl-gamma-glutamyl-phosphate reductase [Fulvivirgaceae bacterium LMO-SS25]
MEKIRAGIIGAAGYTGGELIRILVNHPLVDISFARSASQAGSPVYETHQDLFGETELLFSDSFHFDIDVLFICAGHGEAVKFLQNNHIPKGVRIIDLSQDFRLGEKVNGRTFLYGLPELQREEIRLADNIANPGCFATAIQLGILPLASKGLLGAEIHTTGITGSTGAGVSPSPTSHFSWRANNLSVYKAFQHQHLKEINRTLKQVNEQTDSQILFVPYRGPFTRGIWITSYISTNISQDEAQDIFEDFYEEQPFTHVTKGDLDLKQVVNTNKCIIKLEKQGDKLLIYSIIDNLIKGASGQAVQNMNLMFGLDETAGLKLKSTSF